MNGKIKLETIHIVFQSPTNILRLRFPATSQSRHTRTDYHPVGRSISPRAGPRRRPARPTIGWRRAHSHIGPSPPRWWIQPRYRFTVYGGARSGNKPTYQTHWALYIHIRCIFIIYEGFRFPERKGFRCFLSLRFPTSSLMVVLTVGVLRIFLTQ